MKGHVLFKLLAVASVVLVSACGGKRLNGTEVTTQEATPDKLVLLLHWGSKPGTPEEWQEVKRLGAEHCKKFDKVAGQTKLSLNLGSPSGVATIPCVGKN